MLSILHIITDLDGGGAEAVLARLITADSANAHQVVSLMDAGSVGPVLAKEGIAVHTLNLQHGSMTGAGVTQLYRIVRKLSPDVVQTWMYHADFLGGVVARFASNRPVLWGLHNAYLDRHATRLRTRIIVGACACLSYLVPERIISCSHRGAQLHIARGYARRKMQVIPNGYDDAHFTPNAVARERVRAEWGIKEDTFLIGMVARWDRQKDHANLINALALLHKRLPTPWRCALIGTGMSRENYTLMRMVEDAGIRGRVLLCGPRTDVPGVMNALDVHVLSSMGESFPNVVAEAMSCGTPCVVTDVGDAAFIVGESGWVVPPRQPQALVEALTAAAHDLANADRRQIRQTQARDRVVSQFSIKRMVDNYQRAWSQVAQRASVRPLHKLSFDER